MYRLERNAPVSFKQLAERLSKEGSLWFESAFCKGEKYGALLFTDPVEVVTCFSLLDVEVLFRKLEKRVDEGYFVAGWLSYEAGLAFEPALFFEEVRGGLPSPLAWFGVYQGAHSVSGRRVARLFSEAAGLPYYHALSALLFNLSEEEYSGKIEAIKNEIAAGNVYQANFTGRYRFSFNGSQAGLFARMRSVQPSSYTAWLNCGERIVLSFSPELFFWLHGRCIETRPMKGTARRGSTADEDCCMKEELAQCRKNRAENLMIVDLLRNDLGRICRAGSVQAGELFAIETYPTLHQMVSTIRGEKREEVGLYELFRALYPSGSITGAPKIKAMQLIRSLEREPRGIYTGAIGFITPEREMRFSVAIRTVELCGAVGVYGSGSGIVWDSDPEKEYRECQLKANILASPEQPEFELFESLLWCGRYVWLEEHLDRMAASAASLGFLWKRASAEEVLDQLESTMRRSGQRFKVRLSLSAGGEFTALHEPVTLPQAGRVVRLCLAAHRTESSWLLLYHKTTARKLYDRYHALAVQRGYDEVLFLNERGEVTEGAISTLFIQKGEHFFTPPLQCGLLGGIFRSYFLSTRLFAFEKTVTRAELEKADMIYIANSVRGVRSAFFTGETITLPDTQEV